MNTRARRRLLLAGSALATLAVLTACGSPGTATLGTRRVPWPAPAATAAASSPAATSSSQPPVAITHIHAVARDPKSELLWPPNEGLFRHVNGDLVQNGPVIPHGLCRRSPTAPTTPPDTPASASTSHSRLGSSPPPCRPSWRRWPPRRPVRLPRPDRRIHRGHRFRQPSVEHRRHDVDHPLDPSSAAHTWLRPPPRGPCSPPPKPGSWPAATPAAPGDHCPCLGPPCSSLGPTRRPSSSPPQPPVGRQQRRRSHLDPQPHTHRHR